MTIGSKIGGDGRVGNDISDKGSGGISDGGDRGVGSGVDSGGYGGGGKRNGRRYIIIYDYYKFVVPVRRMVRATNVKYVAKIEFQNLYFFNLN